MNPLGSAGGGGRTHTARILSPLPLPLGYTGYLRLQPKRWLIKLSNNQFSIII